MGGGVVVFLRLRLDCLCEILHIKIVHVGQILKPLLPYLDGIRLDMRA